MIAVSVILPTRNRRATLARAIDSVLGQTFRDFELIVIDDGSTDGTDQLVASYVDPRIRYHFNPGPHSPSHARNIALGLAKGAFIAFQDSDDEWLPQKLEVQVRALKSLPGNVALVYGPSVKHYLNGRVATDVRGKFFAKDKDIFPRVFMSGIGPLQTTLTRREVFDIVGRFDAANSVAEDTDLTFRIARGYRFHFIPDQLVRIHETAGSQMSKHEEYYSTWQRILSKCSRELAEDPKLLIHSYHVMLRITARASRRREALSLLWRLCKHRAIGLLDLCWAAAALTSPRALDWLIATKKLQLKR